MIIWPKLHHQWRGSHYFGCRQRADIWLWWLKCSQHRSFMFWNFWWNVLWQILLAVVLKITLSTIASVPLYAATSVTAGDPPLQASLIDVFVSLFCRTVLTCDFLPPGGCSDECLNHQRECPNQQQMRYNLNSNGGMEHYALKEVTVVSNTWASHLKYLSKLWRKKSVVLFSLQVASEDAERSYFSNRKE